DEIAGLGHLSADHRHHRDRRRRRALGGGGAAANEEAQRARGDAATEGTSTTSHRASPDCRLTCERGASRGLSMGSIDPAGPTASARTTCIVTLAHIRVPVRYPSATAGTQPSSVAGSGTAA